MSNPEGAQPITRKSTSVYTFVQFHALLSTAVAGVWHPFHSADKTTKNRVLLSIPFSKVTIQPNIKDKTTVLFHCPIRYSTTVVK